MKKVTLGFLVLLTTFAMFSCKGKNNLFLPTPTGMPYEVLVVSSDEMWNNPSGRALFDVLDTDVPGLPQSERSFRISHTPKSGFSSLLKTFRNIIEVDIQKGVYSQPKLKFTRDKYASPQMIMTIQAPDEKSFEEFVSQNGQTIINFFTVSEMNREIEILKTKFSEPVNDSIKKYFDCELRIPVDIQSIKVGKDFIWASNQYNASSSIMNFVIYSFPYTDTNTFTLDYFIHKRDSVMKKNIPGEKPNQYMSTDSILVDVTDSSFRDYYMQVARGLWKMKNDLMGGPFVSHSIVDEINGRVIVVEAFIFAPSMKKRDIMRKLEAALFTLKLPADKAIETSTIMPEVIIENVNDSIE